MDIDDQHWEAYWINSTIKILDQAFINRLNRLAERLGV